MKYMKRTILAVAILVISLVAFPICASGATDTSSSPEGGEYISDVRIVSGESGEEVIQRLKDAGYTPVLKNIADEKPELSSPYVYVGYRTSTDPAAALELREAGSTGSVFGESVLMISGIALIIGVVVGMVSMRVRPREKRTSGEK